MSFYQDFLVKSPLFATTSVVSSLDYLEPELRAIIENILEESAAAGAPLLVFETYRSQQRQEMLFERHATELRTVGVHHYGLACDLVKNIGGQPSWKGDFSFMGPLAHKYGLVWGGDWKMQDLDHVQRCTLDDQTYLFAGNWYPDSGYVAWQAGDQTAIV